MDSNDFVSCPICFENYDSRNRVPMMLKECQHSLCIVCLRDLFNSSKSKLECSICRQAQNIQHIDQVPKNRLILQFIEMTNTTKTSNDNNNNIFTNSYQPTAPTISTHSNFEENSYHKPNAPVQIPVNYETAQSSNHHQKWDDKKYFNEMFNDIDHNLDGEINFNELHEALRKGQPNSEFDSKTVELLLNKYDQNNDGEISFNEFYNLFIGINNLYNEFLDIDVDFSGSIDSNELSRSLNNKGYNFSPQFFNFLIGGLSGMSHRDSITFDFYVRVLARLDSLRNQFNTNKNHHKELNTNNHSMEHFIANNFFANF